jgi:hypothetical protein
MAKQREDLEEGEDPSTETTPDEGQPDVQVAEKDGQVTVESDGLTRAERRRQARQKEFDDALEAKMAPMREQMGGYGLSLQKIAEALASRPTPQVVEQQQPGTGKPDEDEKAYLEAMDRQTEIIALMQATDDMPRKEKLAGEWRGLEFRKNKALADSSAKRAGEDIKKSIPVQIPAVSYEAQQLRSEFPDLYAHQDLIDIAQAKFVQAEKSARYGKKTFNPRDASRQAIMDTLHETGVRQRPSRAPSEAQRGRFAGASGSSGTTGGFVPRQLTETEIAMAVASADDNEDPKVAIAKWTKRMHAAGYFDS